MPFIPAAASSTVAYLTKPNPFENPEFRSVTTLAARGRAPCLNYFRQMYSIRATIF